MCGLVGVVKGGASRLLSILEKLQYRGYDSFGIGVIHRGRIAYYKQLGEVQKVELVNGEIGVGHTRWATNGKVSIENAHPIVYKNFAVVQNGIIENYAAIKSEYPDFDWSSETDTECILPLLNYKTISNKTITLGDIEWLLEKLEGQFAILILDSITEAIYFAKKGSNPILIDPHEGLICSDMNAFSFLDKGLGDGEAEKKVIEVVEGGFGYLSKKEFHIFPENQYRILKRIPEPKMTHQNWFESEFFSQVQSLEKAYYRLIGGEFPQITEIDIIGCGSSYLAGKLGEWWFEILTNVRVKSYFPSDYKLLPAKKRANCLVAISQSGETGDVLTALKSYSGKKIGVINVIGSTMCTYVDTVISVGAGREMSVASTKSTSGQMLSMFAWACYVKDFQEKGDSGSRLFAGIKEILPLIADFMPLLLQEIDGIEPAEHIFILASGLLFPIAMEAALKIKELAYLHAEAINSTEMKHGPIARLDEKVLVICFCPCWEPIIDEVASRGARILVFGQEKLDKIKVIQMPAMQQIYQPFAYLLVAQWMANSWAKKLGNRIDMPRNLAKSVTVG